MSSNVKLALFMLVALAGGACSSVAVSALATSSTAQYMNSSGTFTPMPATALTVNFGFDSTLIITFSARGAVAAPTPPATQTPIVFIKCQIDGNACQPDVNPVEFLYPQFCCDTRSFTWVVQNVSAGQHTVAILWGMGNPTSASVSKTRLPFGLLACWRAVLNFSADG